MISICCDDILLATVGTDEAHLSTAMNPVSTDRTITIESDL